MKTLKILIVALVVLALVPQAAPASVTITKSEPSHVKAWNTFLGIRASVIVDVTMTGTLRISESWWATDLEIEQTPASSVYAASHSIAPLVPDPAGGYAMTAMLPWMEANFGNAARACPDLFPPDSFFDVFVSVDLSEWLHSGAPLPPLGALVDIIGGQSPHLPGYKVGMAPVQFDPAIGWANPQPYNGPISVLGHIDISATHGGDDCYNVANGHKDFGYTPIPADFFGPGSDPFDGIVALKGANLTGPDTIVRRLESPLLPDPPPAADTVPIELVQLSLRSTEPITVTYPTGAELWELEVTLQQLPPPPGQMEITHVHEDGPAPRHPHARGRAHPA
jgi:hypothetical protein